MVDALARSESKYVLHTKSTVAGENTKILIGNSSKYKPVELIQSEFECTLGTSMDRKVSFHASP